MKLVALSSLLLVVLWSSCVAPPPRRTYNRNRTPPPPTCNASGPLNYKVKMKYNVTFTYTPKGGQETSGNVVQWFQKELETLGNNGYGYEFAEGTTPNLILNMTFNNDNSENKSMRIDVSGLGKSGWLFGVSTDGTYQDATRMVHDMAAKINGYVSQGWHCN